jgi:hypothetical protein
MSDDVAMLVKETVQVDQGALAVPLEQRTADLAQPSAGDRERIWCDRSQGCSVGFGPPPAGELGARGDDVVDRRDLGEQGAASLGEGEDRTVEMAKALEHGSSFEDESSAHAGVGVVAAQGQA